MIDRIGSIFAPLLLVALIVVGAGSAATAADAVWRVSKSTGDVSVTTAAGEQTALAEGATVNPGDNIRTGQTGRVLLKRNEETILISPNSAMGIPAEKKSELTTVIIQQAGSILLDVEKRNVKHFSVETPYLAAVVKGTQFRVTVNEGASRVDVLRGQVEVHDLKSGQYAMVLPEQAATVSVQGLAGLMLSGAGTLNPVQQGTPRGASVNPTLATTSAQPTRMAAAPEVQPARTWSSPTPPKEFQWTSIFGSFGKGFLSSGGRTTARTTSWLPSPSPARSALACRSPSPRNGAEKAGDRPRADAGVGRLTAS